MAQPGILMDSTIRLLLIACPPELNSALEDGGVELHLASRPAEALRRFDTLSPDGVMVGIGRRPEQAALMVQALRDRPLGSLVPIVLIDRGEAPAHPLTTPSGAAEAGADRYFAPGSQSGGQSKSRS